MTLSLTCCEKKAPSFSPLRLSERHWQGNNHKQIFYALLHMWWSGHFCVVYHFPWPTSTFKIWILDGCRSLVEWEHFQRAQRESLHLPRWLRWDLLDRNFRRFPVEKTYPTHLKPSLCRRASFYSNFIHLRNWTSFVRNIEWFIEVSVKNWSFRKFSYFYDFLKFCFYRTINLEHSITIKLI